MKQDELQKIKSLRSDSLDFRRMSYEDTQWKQFEDYWQGKYPGDNEDVLNIPTLVADAQRLVNDIIGDNIKVSVTSNDPQLLPAARVHSAKLNQLIKDTGLIDEIKDAVQDTVTLGTGGLLDGFGSQYGVHSSTLLEGADSSRKTKHHAKIEYHDNIYDDRPWSLRTHPSDILFPPGTVNAVSAYGFFHRYVRHVEDIRRDEKLIKKHRKKIEPNAGYDYGGMERTPGASSDNEMVVMYDYYDLRLSRRTTFTLDYAFALADDPDEIMLRIDRLPIHIITFAKPPRTIWGSSDFHLQEPMAQEINNIRTRQAILGNISIAKGVYDKTKLEADELPMVENAMSSMTSDKVMALIGINGSPKDFIHQFTPQQPFDNTPQINMAREEIQDYLGIGPNQRGNLSTGRHTKYETQVAESHSDKSLFPRRRTLRDIIIRTLENWSQLMFDFNIEPEIIQTYGAFGEPVSVEYTGLEIRGDYRYDISMESMRAKSQSEKIAEANMIMEKMQPFVQMQILSPEPLARQYLARLGSDWNIDAMFPKSQGAPQQPVPFGQFQQQFLQGAQKGPPGLAQLINAQGQPAAQGGG